MRIIVIGAGLEGITTAWSLARDGHQVSVVERRDGPALETSFANGGQVSVSHPEPWANPRAPLQILRWLGREDAPLKFRLPAEWARWRWGLAFLRECVPWRTARNTEAIARLAAHSLRCLHAVRDSFGLDYAAQQQGVLHLFFDEDDLRRAPARAAQLQRLGLRAEVLDRGACLTREPALAASRRRILGALHGLDDESGDAHLFTTGLATALAAQGVTFHYGLQVTALEVLQGRFTGVHVRHADGHSGLLGAEACVVAAGPWARALLEPLGLRLPIYPVKGYSVTLPLRDTNAAPQASLTDETRRVVCSRLGDRLRVAGTAELCGFDLTPNPARTQALLRWVEDTLPGVADTARHDDWCGLRPTTPSNVPLLGAIGPRGVWVNGGHGTLGWTLACGAADVLARLIAGEQAPLPGFPTLDGSPRR